MRLAKIWIVHHSLPVLNCILFKPKATCIWSVFVLCLQDRVLYSYSFYILKNVLVAAFGSYHNNVHVPFLLILYIQCEYFWSLWNTLCVSCPLTAGTMVQQWVSLKNNNNVYGFKKKTNSATVTSFIILYVELLKHWKELFPGYAPF